MKLIVGLGNPGEKYEATRHNAGFVAVEQLAKAFGFEPFKESLKHQADLSEGEIAGEKVLLVKPNTFMNLSGRSARSLIHFYKVEPQDILVIYDEVALDSGILRFRPEGSAGGHKGIKSLIQELDTSAFHRLRLGVKPLVPFPGDLADYVLGKFTEEEKELLQKTLDHVPQAVELWVKERIEAAMNRFN